MPNKEDPAEIALRERIRDAIQSHGKAPAIAKATGIPLGTLNKYVAMRSVPSATNALKIASVTGLSLQDLVTDPAMGTGGLLHHVQETIELEAEVKKLVAEMVKLPQYEVRASAGHGIIAIDQMPSSEVAFGRNFIRNLGGNPDRCYVLEARGDSMWPTIPDGALLIADASQTQVDDGRIYHFNVNERVLVKRARWNMDGRLFLTSDNAAAGYPPESFNADRVDDLYVSGRVIFVGHSPMPVR